MTSVFAIVRRILTQFALDKRTLALLFVAPLVVLWLLSVLLGADAYEPRLATVDLPWGPKLPPWTCPPNSKRNSNRPMRA